jgi:hypothetical protein
MKITRVATTQNGINAISLISQMSTLSLAALALATINLILFSVCMFSFSGTRILSESNPLLNIETKTTLIANEASQLLRNSTQKKDYSGARIKSVITNLDHGNHVYNTAKRIIYIESDFQDFANAVFLASNDMGKLLRVEEWAYQSEKTLEQAIKTSRTRQRELREAAKVVAIRLREKRQ